MAFHLMVAASTAHGARRAAPSHARRFSAPSPSSLRHCYRRAPTRRRASQHAGGRAVRVAWLSSRPLQPHNPAAKRCCAKRCSRCEVDQLVHLKLRQKWTFDFPEYRARPKCHTSDDLRALPTRDRVPTDAVQLTRGVQNSVTCRVRMINNSGLGLI